MSEHDMTPADEDLVFGDDSDVRETTITLRVTWNPVAQDHPAGWDWSTLLDCDVSVRDFEDA